MDSGQRKGIKRKNLQCPLTWGIPVHLYEYESDDREEDYLYLSADTWALILMKLQYAHYFLVRDDVKRCRSLLVECYMPLLEVDGFYKSDSDLTELYRIALKHVIDSMWAFTCCKTTPVRELESFLDSITIYDSMTDIQKSAIWGIRGRLTYNDDGLRATEIAISLNPNEGEWYLYKALLLRLKSINSPINSIDELKALEASYNLRSSPQSMVSYGVALSQQLRTTDIKKGLQLLRDALIKWPNSIYVNYESDAAFSQNHTKSDNLIQAERCLRHAVKLVGQRNCRSVIEALGIFLFHFKDEAEGSMYLQMANE